MRTAKFILGSGIQAAPRQMGLTLLLTFGVAAAGVLYPIGFRVLVNGLTGSHHSSIVFGVALVAVSYPAAWAVAILVTVESVSLTDRVALYLACRTAELVSGPDGIEHFERPDYLSELALLQTNQRVLADGPRQALLFVQMVLRWAATLLVLALIDPRLAGLVVFAVPVVVVARSNVSRQEVAEYSSISNLRFANALFSLTASAHSAKEIRTFGLFSELSRLHGTAAQKVITATTRVSIRTTWQGVLAWGTYGAGFVLALVIVTQSAKRGHASLGDLVLAITLIRQSQVQVARTSDVLSQLALVARTVRRFVNLERHLERRVPSAPVDAPLNRLNEAIRFDHVSFCYPGAETSALEDLNLTIPAGSTVALVGENGAGKTTIVKLLLKMYEPTTGKITVDGVDITAIPSQAWRECTSSAFQDFVQFEFVIREIVGIGDLSRIADDRAVVSAIDRASAPGLIPSLGEGLDTPIGRSFPNGRDLSKGQWQQLALSRAMMRETPIVLVLDEPTASLDPPTEHALFERYAASSTRKAFSVGGITILVSHRFSTVRMADLIVVLQNGRVVEAGSHDQLLKRGGLYSELFELQARLHR